MTITAGLSKSTWNLAILQGLGHCYTDHYLLHLHLHGTLVSTVTHSSMRITWISVTQQSDG